MNLVDKTNYFAESGSQTNLIKIILFIHFTESLEANTGG